MSDYLCNLIARNYNLIGGIKPRIASIFEPGHFLGNIEEMLSITSPDNAKSDRIGTIKGDKEVHSMPWTSGSDQENAELDVEKGSHSLGPVQQSEHRPSLEQLHGIAKPSPDAKNENREPQPSLPLGPPKVESRVDLPVVLTQEASLHLDSPDMENSHRIQEPSPNAMPELAELIQSAPSKAVGAIFPESLSEVAKPDTPLKAFGEAIQAGPHPLETTAIERELSAALPVLPGKKLRSGDMWRPQVATQKEVNNQPDTILKEDRIKEIVHLVGASEGADQNESNARQSLALGKMKRAAPSVLALEQRPIPRHGLDRSASSLFETESSNETTINVTIGKIVVRAVKQPEREVRRTEQRPPIMSLDDYLRARKGGA